MSVTLKKEGRVATLAIDRPPLNILDIATLERLDQAIGELAGDPELQLVFVRGAGERAFSVGVSVQDHTLDKIDSMLGSLHSAIRRLRDLPAVTVAAVAGHCLGGGMELALGCDLVLATEDAKFGLPEIKLGCFPPVAAALYPSLLGAPRTLELILTGRTFDCAEADRLGLLSRRLPTGGLEAGMQEFAAEITAQSAEVTRLAKRAVAAGRDRSFSEALTETERLYCEDLARTEDLTEGIAAFLDKRPPVWKHR